VLGGLVANWLSEPENEIEIRHIAVCSNFQGLSVGKSLVEKLIKLVQKGSHIKIQTCARNTSVGFFTKLGFISTSEYQEHQDFALHGIKFQQMHLDAIK